jgi:hypothetical protein
VNIAPSDFDKGLEPEKAPFDLVDELGGSQDIRLFTAAFMSARFPLISSAGRLPSCAPVAGGTPKCPKGLENADVINVVDGGYAENSGTAQMGELWAQLGPLITAHNALAGKVVKVKPLLVVIDNGESGVSVSGIATGGGGQLLAPLRGIINVQHASSGGSQDALTAAVGQFPGRRVTQSASVFFTLYPHPGRRLPLGWTLSSNAINDLPRQLELDPNDAHVAAFFARMAGSGTGLHLRVQ